MIHIHYLHQLVIIVQLASQAAMKVYYWSDLYGYVIGDKSISQMKEKISQKGWILIHICSQIFSFIFFIDFDCHQLRLFFFLFQSKYLFPEMGNWNPLFSFLFCNWKVMDQNCMKLLVGVLILSLEIQMRILYLFKFIHLWLLLMKYKMD